MKTTIICLSLLACIQLAAYLRLLYRARRDIRKLIEISRNLMAIIEGKTDAQL